MRFQVVPAAADSAVGLIVDWDGKQYRGRKTR
jgi:hypothetical protein